LVLAATFQTPEVVYSEEEAKALAIAGANVARHYPMEVAQKTLDWCNLGFVLGGQVFARGYNINQRKKAERARNVTPATDNISPFPGSMQ